MKALTENAFSISVFLKVSASGQTGVCVNNGES